MLTRDIIAILFVQYRRYYLGRDFFVKTALNQMRAGADAWLVGAQLVRGCGGIGVYGLGLDPKPISAVHKKGERLAPLLLSYLPRPKPGGQSGLVLLGCQIYR